MRTHTIAASLFCFALAAALTLGATQAWNANTGNGLLSLMLIGYAVTFGFMGVCALIKAIMPHT